MLQYDDIPGTYAAERLVGIDDELAVCQRFYLIILILEVESAIIILEGPEKGQTVRVTAVFCFCFAFSLEACAIGPEYNGIVPFCPGNTGVQGIEVDLIIIVVICTESCLFIFPGGAGEQVKVMA